MSFILSFWTYSMKKNLIAPKRKFHLLRRTLFCNRFNFKFTKLLFVTRQLRLNHCLANFCAEQVIKPLLIYWQTQCFDNLLKALFVLQVCKNGFDLKKNKRIEPFFM